MAVIIDLVAKLKMFGKRPRSEKQRIVMIVDEQRLTGFAGCKLLVELVIWLKWRSQSPHSADQ